MNLKSQAIYGHNFFFKQCIYIWKDGASGEKVGDIEMIIVNNLFKNYLNYINWWILEEKKLGCSQVYSEIRNMKKIQA